MPSPIATRLQRIFHDHFHISADRLEPSTDLVHDLRLDSLDTVELVMACEEEWRIASIPDEDAERIITFGDLEKYLEKHGRG